jgi:uncharacterized protein
MTVSKASAQTLSISLAGEILTLLPQRAVWWAAQKTVFVADLHFGKEATFRAAAIPVPDQTTQNLKCLTSVIDETQAERLVILGDLIHARRGRCEQTFSLISQWRNAHADLKIELVRGNHDQSAGDPPAAWRIECWCEPLIMLPFLLCHHPQTVPGHIVLAGHLHPTVRLTGPARDSLKLPCFLLRDGILNLPAFSCFIDGAAVRGRPGDRVFGISEQQVVLLK